MSWRVISASEVGTSHIANGTGCEDSCWAQVSQTGGTLPFLAMFVSDGAGSAQRGAEGAELAIQTAVAFIEDKLKEVEFSLNDELATQCIVAIRDVIYAQAEAQGLVARDYACTFLGVLSFKLGTLAFQVGDGGIVIDVGEGLQVPIVPMSGEYANMTNFVTDEDAVLSLESKSYPSIASRAAVFSDGLQRLALNMADNTPHEPFFANFFNVLGAAGADQEDALNSALVRFLRSPAVNERTDDDKTLAIALLTG